MADELNAKKEINLLLLAFIVIGLLIIGTKSFEYITLEKVGHTTSDIYNHPFKVSNAALNIKADLFEMHRDLKDIVLSISTQEINNLSEKINQNEKQIYIHLNVIEQNILGSEGLALQREAKDLFEKWKPIRNEVITFMKNDEIEQAIDSSRGKGANHIEKLETSTIKLHTYASAKALEFKNTSESGFKTLQSINFAVNLTFLLFFIAIGYYIILRLSSFISKNEHLKGVLAVIRDVNQLIVREKNQQTLLEQACCILTSNHVYSNAWIAVLDNNHKFHYFTKAGSSENLTLFQEKINSGWIPHCIENNLQANTFHSVIKNTSKNCPKCPFADLYNNQCAFTIELKHREKIYGYLTLALNQKYSDNSEEISLLHEVAGDIAYALYNLEVEKSVLDLKELYSNIIDSVENLIFVKDANGIYIACNTAFEKLMGKPKDEIIGKNDFDLFDKELAEFFREHDKKAFLSKEAKSNYEWLTYPDGRQSYSFTTKAPLYDSNDNIIGIVGNSLDLTEQKKIEDALLESEEQFKSLMEQSPSAIEIYNKDGLQIAVNHAYESLWGFPANHTLNKFNLFKSTEVKKTGLLEYIKKAYAGEPVKVPLYEYNSTGETEANGLGRIRWLNTTIYPLKDAKGAVNNIVITHEDATDRQDALASLEQKKNELETIIQEAPNPVMIHNEDGKVLILNKVWKELTGYSHDEIGTIEKWTKKAYGNTMPMVKDYINKLYTLKHPINEGTYAITTHNGETIYWQFNSAPLGLVDGKRTVISSAMDITELKKKDELMIVQSRHAAMGEMIGMIAHQWRQPISVIAMDANNMLLDIELGSFQATQAEKYAQDILNRTQHLSKTIDDFRNFFKPDKSISMVKIENVITDTYSIVKESLKNHNITLKTSYASESTIPAYPRELMQVFVNIITNAKDALLSNHIKDPCISVNVYEDDDYVTTDICDNGKGINEAILPKIFDPYFSTKEELSGTGLGLYMSKMIIEEHLQGKIEAINRDNGVCLRVKLRKERNLIL